MSSPLRDFRWRLLTRRPSRRRHRLLVQARNTSSCSVGIGTMKSRIVLDTVTGVSLRNRLDQSIRRHTRQNERNHGRSSRADKGENCRSHISVVSDGRAHRRPLLRTRFQFVYEHRYNDAATHNTRSQSNKLCVAHLCTIDPCGNRFSRDVPVFVVSSILVVGKRSLIGGKGLMCGSRPAGSEMMQTCSAWMTL